MITTLTANQNPSSFKEVEHLKWQMPKQNVTVCWCGH